MSPNNYMCVCQWCKKLYMVIVMMFTFGSFTTLNIDFKILFYFNVLVTNILGFEFLFEKL